MAAIKGLEKFASKDYPGYISATIFLGGCNFRCPFCHNADLVLRPETLPTIASEEFLGFLDERRDWLEAVCVTGGEPLMTPDLDSLLGGIKTRGLRTKLDTNGSLPDRLAAVLGSGLVDAVAMDVKAPPVKYWAVTRSEVREEDIRRSVEIIRGSGLEYMFRTTAVPGLVDEADLVAIGRWLEGADFYQLQPFVARNTLDPEFLKVKPYSKETMEQMAAAVRPYFKEVRLEGM
ncbi:MAG: anaerobic ribonucleoside-triphosphate reductase activating protein [Candidatus Aminicenantes bacterium]|nr:anaerobic ribonucleoside-triphosphate reductase activating protein [Candidatus Aminicenantes bacterium]